MPINKHSLEHVGFVNVEGGHIEYRYYIPHDEKHAERTPLIVTHGGPGSSSILLYDVLHELADTRPILFYDQLGSYCSKANLSKKLMTMQRFANEPYYVMKALSIEKASVLGHSWGGAVMLGFSLNYPELVDKLILSSPLVSTQRWVDDCNKLLLDMPQDIQDTINTCQANNTTDSQAYKLADKAFSARHYCRSGLSAEARKASHKRSNGTLYNTMWGPSEFSHNGLLADVDFFPQLHELTMPTLMICGEYDTATPSTMMDVKQAIGSQAEVAVMPDAGHSCFIDAYDEYVRALEGFLDKTR